MLRLDGLKIPDLAWKLQAEGETCTPPAGLIFPISMSQRAAFTSQICFLFLSAWVSQSVTSLSPNQIKRMESPTSSPLSSRCFCQALQLLLRSKNGLSPKEHSSIFHSFSFKATLRPMRIH